MTDTLTGSPTKLRDGTWGVRVHDNGSELEGATVTVKTRTGKTWDATISEVVARFEAGELPVALCKTEAADRPQREQVAEQESIGALSRRIHELESRVRILEDNRPGGSAALAVAAHEQELDRDLPF